MPPVDPFNEELARFYERQFEGSQKRARRIEEALCAALVGQNGFDEQGRLIIDTDRMARASLAGHHIKVEADGARMVFTVVDDKDNHVPIQPRQRPATRTPASASSAPPRSPR